MKINPILPKAFSGKIKRLDRAVAAGMRAAAEQVQADFEQTTATWEHVVTFTITPDGENLIVGTDDERWRWINEGTAPFQMPAIVPKTKKGLTIVGPGVPKTAPGRVRAVSGSKGAVIVVRRRTKPYTHPGIKPRDFSGAIAKRWLRRVAPIVQAAIREALR